MTRSDKYKIEEEKQKQKRKEEKKKRFRKNLIKTTIFIFLSIFATFYYMRFYEVKRLEVNEIKVEDKLIPESFNGFKIVHISDIHYKMTTEKLDLEKMVNKINKLKPDILVFTGDLLDETIDYEEKDYQELEEILLKIDVTMTKYYIKGNHDYNFDNIEDIFYNSGFVSLNNSEDLIYLSDNEFIKLKGYGSSIKNDFNYQDNNNGYTISIIHEPDNANIIKDSNLILAGHSHNLQINIPVIKTLFKVNGCNNYYDNYYDLGNTKLYINSGIGTSIYKLRLLTPPTINFYRLANK